MKPIHISAVILLALFPFVKGVVMADEIWLANGDHISGTVVRLESNRLILNTPYAGEISVKWKDIVNLKTDAPVKVKINSDTIIEGIISPGENGKITVQSADIQDPLPIEIARIQVINPKAPEPALKTNARVNLGASFTDGNTETQNIYGDGELVARTQTNRYTLGAVYKRSENADVATANSIHGYMKYDHFLTKKWFFYANATGEKDKFKDLELRTSAGIGSGYQFLETEMTRLSLEAGLSYVNEDYITADDHGFAAGRWGLRFEHFFHQKRLQLFHYQTGLQSLEDFDDLVVYTQTGLRVPLYQYLNVALQFNFDYDKSPAQGKENQDTAVIATLGYQWSD